MSLLRRCGPGRNRVSPASDCDPAARLFSLQRCWAPLLVIEFVREHDTLRSVSTVIGRFLSPTAAFDLFRGFTFSVSLLLVGSAENTLAGNA